MTSAVVEFARMRFPNLRHKITAVEIAGGTGCSYVTAHKPVVLIAPSAPRWAQFPACFRDEVGERWYQVCFLEPVAEVGKE